MHSDVVNRHGIRPPQGRTQGQDREVSDRDLTTGALGLHLADRQQGRGAHDDAEGLGDDGEHGLGRQRALLGVGVGPKRASLRVTTQSGAGAMVGAAMTGQLVIALMLATVVFVPVFFVLRGEDDRPAKRLMALIRAWRSRDG
jgi:hypothetical protein